MCVLFESSNQICIFLEGNFFVDRVIECQLQMEKFGLNRALANAWVELFRKGKEGLEDFGIAYLNFWYKVTELFNDDFRELENIRIPLEIVNRTQLKFSKDVLNNGLSVFRVTSCQTEDRTRRRFDQNAMQKVKIRIFRNQIMRVFNGGAVPDPATQKKIESLTSEIKDSYTARYANLLKVAGYEESLIKSTLVNRVTLKGRQGKFKKELESWLQTHLVS